MLLIIAIIISLFVQSKIFSVSYVFKFQTINRISSRFSLESAKHINNKSLKNKSKSQIKLVDDSKRNNGNTEIDKIEVLNGKKNISPFSGMVIKGSQF
jgi:hypothetical protein